MEIEKRETVVQVLQVTLGPSLLRPVKVDDASVRDISLSLNRAHLSLA